MKLSVMILALHASSLLHWIRLSRFVYYFYDICMLFTIHKQKEILLKETPTMVALTAMFQKLIYMSYVVEMVVMVSTRKVWIKGRER